MKKAKYALYCCVVVISLALLIILTNVNNKDANATTKNINITCEREIVMPNNTNLELDSNAVSFGSYNLSDFNISISSKSNENEEGLKFENGKFTSSFVGSYIVTFSIDYNGNTYKDFIVINVEESLVNSNYVLYINSPQSIEDLFKINYTSDLNFIVDNEFLKINNDSIVGLETGITQVKLLKTYNKYKIWKELNIEVLSVQINVENVYNFKFAYKENEVYSMQFKLDSNISLTNQDLVGINYDSSLIEIINFDSPLIHIMPKAKCITTISLTFKTLDKPIQFNIEFI